MSAPPARHGKVRFGDFELDLASAEIERQGQRQRLPDQAFEVLALLIARCGELVTREELIAALWPTTTYIDTDAGLNTAVKKLRSALGDDAEAPRYIETVPRRGYRFLVEYQPVVPRRGGRWIAVLGACALLGVGYWLWPKQAHNTVATAVSGSTPAAANNIAVLPFLNLTGKSQYDHLALGLAENVLHQLAQQDRVGVIARTSSFQFQDRTLDVRDIGRKLNTRYLLEGSVQESAGQLRVITQLIDADNGAHIWSKSFDRPQQDIFDVEDEIALAVANTLQIGARNSQAEPLRHSGTANPDAWLAFAQGRALATTRNFANLEAAVRHFQRAVQLDPQFANAYVELADVYQHLPLYAPPQSDADRRAAIKRSVELSRTTADRALALDPSLGEALIVRGLAARSVDDWATVEADLRAGLAVSPNSARGHQGLGELLVEIRRQDDAGLALMQRAQLLNPLEPRSTYYMGWVEMRRGNIDAAERWLQASLQIDPNYSPALARLSFVSWQGRGRFADAVKYAELALRADPQAEWIRDNVIANYLLLGDKAAAESLMPKTPVNASLDMAVSFINGDVRRAAKVLFQHMEQFAACDTSSAGKILIEYAHTTHDYERARQLLERSAKLTGSGDDVVIPVGSEYAVAFLAHTLLQTAQQNRARALLLADLAQLERSTTPVTGRCSHVLRNRARVLALLGRRAEALTLLEQILLNENSWYDGWFLFDRDPIFAGLRGDARFANLHRAFREHMDAERAQLAKYRALGLVPKRP
jgi:TolB-like protein/DNA-binding winged helix-turn-helix (wHTH) protein